MSLTGVTAGYKKINADYFAHTGTVDVQAFLTLVGSGTKKFGFLVNWNKFYGGNLTRTTQFGMLLIRGDDSTTALTGVAINPAFNLSFSSFSPM